MQSAPLHFSVTSWSLRLALFSAIFSIPLLTRSWQEPTASQGQLPFGLIFSPLSSNPFFDAYLLSLAFAWSALSLWTFSLFDKPPPPEVYKKKTRKLFLKNSTAPYAFWERGNIFLKGVNVRHMTKLTALGSVACFWMDLWEPDSILFHNQNQLA